MVKGERVLIHRCFLYTGQPMSCLRCVFVVLRHPQIFTSDCLRCVILDTQCYLEMHLILYECPPSCKKYNVSKWQFRAHFKLLQEAGELYAAGPSPTMA